MCGDRQLESGRLLNHLVRFARYHPAGDSRPAPTVQRTSAAPSKPSCAEAMRKSREGPCAQYDQLSQVNAASQWVAMSGSGP
jgi:hypothetical protein